MNSCGDVNGPPAGKALVRSRLARRHRQFAGLGCVQVICAALALAGCSLNEGPGEFLVDPGRYAVYHCNDLAKRWTELINREKELRGLMEKASEGGGGAVIGTLAYRSDYESVLTEEKLVQRQAAEKKCDPLPAVTNGQDVR